jgi:hypothetical protein
MTTPLPVTYASECEPVNIFVGEKENLGIDFSQRDQLLGGDTLFSAALPSIAPVTTGTPPVVNQGTIYTPPNQTVPTAVYVPTDATNATPGSYLLRQAVTTTSGAVLVGEIKICVKS